MEAGQFQSGLEYAPGDQYVFVVSVRSLQTNKDAAIPAKGNEPRPDDFMLLFRSS